MMSQDSTPDRTSLATLFAHWSGADDLRSIAHSSLIRRRFSAGETIAREFEIPQEWVFVLEGTAYVTQMARSGREAVVERLRPGRGSGVLALAIMVHAPLQGELVAGTDVEVAVLPARDFCAAFGPQGEFPWIQAGVLTDVSRLLADVTEELVEGGGTRVATRLASTLLHHAQRAGEAAEIPITHSQLARELGVARETVSRQLRRMARDGVIETHHGVIVVTTLRALEEMAVDA